MKRLRARVVRNDRGAVLPILALFIVVLVLATSLAVDIGRLSDRNRDLQKVADLVALDAVRGIGTTHSAALVATGSTFLTGIENSAQNNGFPVVCTTSTTQANYEASCASTQAGSRDTLTVDLGFWCTATDATNTSSPCNGAVIPAGKPGVLLYDTSGNNTPTAVQVGTGDFIKYYFGLGLVNGQSASRSGTADLSATADFGLGTSLASLNTNQSALLGPLLNALLGFNLSGQVVGYKGLASADLTLGALASQLGFDLGSSTTLLNSNVTLAGLYTAGAQVLSQNGDVADAALLNSIATSVPSPLRNVSFTLGDLFDVSASDLGAALSSDVNVLQLVNAAAQVANGSNAITLTSPGIALPGGLATIGSVGLTITQPVKFKYHAHVGDTLEAGQVALSLNVINISTAAVTSILTGLVGGLVGLVVTVGPATVSAGVANGQATLTSVTCTPNPSFTVSVSSGAASLTMSLPITAKASLPLIGVIPLIGGSLVATQTQNNVTKSLTFTFPPDTPGAAKDAGGGSLFWNSPPNVSTSNLTLAGILNVGLLTSQLTSSLVVPLLNGINTQVIQPMQSLLGLTVADATVFSGSTTPAPVYCNTPELVQ